jgi:hypothetical protein
MSHIHAVMVLEMRRPIQPIIQLVLRSQHYQILAGHHLVRNLLVGFVDQRMLMPAERLR